MVWSKCLNHMGRKRLPSTAPVQMNVRKQNSLEFGEILSLFLAVSILYCFPDSQIFTASVMLGGPRRRMASPAQKTKMNAASIPHLVQSKYNASTRQALSTVGPAQQVHSWGPVLGPEYHTDRGPESISLC